MVDNEVKCLKCGHQWPARVPEPLECPDCKARLNRQRGKLPPVQTPAKNEEAFSIEQPEEL